MPGEPLFAAAVAGIINDCDQDNLTIRRLFWLQRVYGLSDFDLDALLIALAPEVDLRYERLYAYLQDDVSRRHPGIDLALNLLCFSGEEKLRQRGRFSPDSPLIKNRLIELLPEPARPAATLLSRHYRLDEQITRFILLDDGLDSRLAEFCHPVGGENAPLPEEMQRQLLALAERRPSSGIRLYFQGPSNCGQAQAVALLGSALGLGILKADIQSSANAGIAPTREIMHTLVREAWFSGKLLYLQGLDSCNESGLADRRDALWQALKSMPADCVIEGESSWVPSPHKPLGVVTVPFSYPATEQRMAWWQHCLTQQKIQLGEATVTDLALRYRVTYAQIQDAVAVTAIKAGHAHGSINTKNGTLVVREVFAAARAQSGHQLATLATKIEPHATWDDLVLPEDETAQLHEICARFNYRDQVFNGWGFAQKISYGRGITALFSGGSGTGKTMAAEVIANALELDLYRIDLAQVVSKYIGETEKNLDRVFAAATNANAILFFDEADALFGKRTEVKDSHDRYANLEISYLLQKMEQYEGIAILATNLADNLDQAFTRRLAFSIHFPFPDKAARMQIWQGAWPHDFPLSQEVDFRLLARELKLSGGNIRNIVLSAAFNGAEGFGDVELHHVLQAVRREMAKTGSAMTVPLSLQEDRS